VPPTFRFHFFPAGIAAPLIGNRRARRRGLKKRWGRNRKKEDRAGRVQSGKLVRVLADALEG